VLGKARSSHGFPSRNQYCREMENGKIAFSTCKQCEKAKNDKKNLKYQDFFLRFFGVDREDFWRKSSWAELNQYQLFVYQ